MKVLIYARLWNKDFFTKLAYITFPDSTIIYFSDFKNVGDVWAGEYIYSNDYDKHRVEEKKAQEIITRCRFLRGLDHCTALMLCCRMYNGLSELFNKNCFDVVLMPTIDCYSLDVLDYVAKENRVPVIAFVQNFIKGYSRFSIRGERNDLHRSVQSDEVDTVYKMLSKVDYTPGFSLNTKLNKTTVIKRYLRTMCKEKIYYTYRKIKDHDKYNYHYATLSEFSIKKSFNQLSDVGFERLSDIKDIEREKTIYIPLHFTPEATVDYWSDNPEDCYYETRILRIIKDADPEIVFLIKEHPAMMGRRDDSFYQKLYDKPNVHLIHPYDNSNILLDLVDTVAVHTGSVGVEALLRGKRVLAFTNNYYSDLHPNITVIKKLTMAEMTKPVVDYDPKDFIMSLLDGLFPYKYAAGWKVYEDSDDVNVLATWCKKYYDLCINNM